MSAWGSANKILIEALSLRENAYRTAIDGLLSAVEDDQAAYDSARMLRESAELVGCLRRIVAECNVEQIHRAFGAPGDFGYETILGDALYRLYRAKSEEAK